MKLCVIALAALLAAVPAAALAADPCVPEPGGKCLTKDQFEQVKKALSELDSIHKAPAVVTSVDPIVVVYDWEGRVYVNGGSTAPLRLKVKVGETVDRDLLVTLPANVYYREKPADPPFRIRIRAQAGLLVPEMVRTASGDKQSFWDGGVGLDFFHLGSVNLSANVGVRSAGGGIGLDLTRNFGPYVSYALVYDGFRSSVQIGSYFSFN